jgi:stalled ribosome rescue protein Dom34
MAVWLDHDNARVFHVTAESFVETTVHAPKHQIRRNQPSDEGHYFRDVAKHLATADAILLLGPSLTKLHFLRWLREHASVIEARVVGMETVDHPTDRQIVAHVRAYFQPPE